MKTDNDLKLLDAVLEDAEWSSCNFQVQQAGLSSLRARKKARARLAFATQLFLGTLVTAMCAWLIVAKPARFDQHQLALSTHSGHPTASAAKHPAFADDSHYISEEQMLNMFPKGSCLVAEVNGEKQLVFLENR